MTDQATSTLDDQTYTVTNTARTVWSPTGTIVVEEDGIAVNPVTDPYTLDRLRGRVIFDGVAVRGAITVTGDYLPMAVAAKSKSFMYGLMRTVLDDTGFEDAGWVTRIAGMLDASGSLGRRWTVDEYFQDALLNADLVVLDFTFSAGVTPDLLIWARIAKDQLSSAVEGLVEEDITFEGTTDADNRVVSVE
jgi:hypothetical protein